MGTDDLTRAQREALKAIHRFQSANVGRVQTGELAAALGRSAASVIATVKQLAELGVVDHHPYRGVELTRPGDLAAADLLRRHRVVERFLTDVLGFGGAEVEHLAASFEHALPDDVEQRLGSLITDPDNERRERAC